MTLHSQALTQCPGYFHALFLQVQRIVDQARKNDGVPRTAQQSIPFDRMFPEGICRVGDNYYTRTVQFQDINYQLAQQEDKTAIFVPFTTQELFQNGKEALYYGLNALSNNLIMVDRKALKNPNGLILGTPGSGKSFSAKREIANAFLVTDDDIIICDPEAEYTALVRRSDGQRRISDGRSHYRSGRQ